jgi:retinol dehydrogenase-12
MDWTDLMFEKNYKNFAAYVQSKLANILFTRELSKRIPHGITTYSLHPGVVKTDITRNMADHYGFVYSLVDLILKPVVWLVFKNAKQGAQTSIHLATATDDQLKNSNGKYFSDCSEQPLLSHALSDTDALKLWIESEKLVEGFLKK